MAASTITKFFLPVRFTYSTRVTRIPALPEMNLPGSSRMRSPSGFSRGHECGRVARGGEDPFRLGFPPPVGAAAGQGGLIDDAQTAADAEKLEGKPGRELFQQGHHFSHGQFKRFDRGE